MQASKMTQTIISQVLFGVDYERLTPLWQQKVDQATYKIITEVIKPLRMMNSALLDTEEKLKSENMCLLEEINFLRSYRKEK